jgi:hypothetical protein
VGGYDTKLNYAEDWKLYLALAEICQFAVVPMHHVGYRRTTSSASRNLSAMAEGLQRVSSWIMERHMDVPSNVIRQMIYSRNAYLTHLALTTDQFANSVRYQIKAYIGQPKMLLSSSPFVFATRLAARRLGIKRRAFSFPSQCIRFADYNDELLGR